MNSVYEGCAPPGAYEELVLDFWEQAQPSQIPKVLLMNDYGGQVAPWFTLRAKLPFAEMEGRWRGRMSPEFPEDQAENMIRCFRRAWHNLSGEILGFPDIAHALVRLAMSACSDD